MDPTQQLPQILSSLLTWQQQFPIQLVNGVPTFVVTPSFTSPVVIDGDVVLVRSAANTLAMRNGTNPQTFIVNGTFTDTSNYRRLRVGMNASGVATIASEGLGTGLTGNSLQLLVDGVNAITYSAAGVLSTAVSFQIASGSSLRFGSTRSRIASPADGQINMTTAGGATLTELQFGGTKVLGVRNTGWTAQTAVAAKGDLGASPTVGALASWASAIQAALTTHGILGA